MNHTVQASFRPSLGGAFVRTPEGFRPATPIAPFAKLHVETLLEIGVNVSDGGKRNTRESIWKTVPLQRSGGKTPPF